MTSNSLIKRVKRLTIPCTDNGKKFVKTERIVSLKNELSRLSYKCFELPLALIYIHDAHDKSQPSILLSSHIDSVYDVYYAEETREEVTGTFDDSICNAVMVDLLSEHRLSRQIVIAFTGNEEEDSLGVDHTVQFLKDLQICDEVQAAISLDVTEEFYGISDYTIENYYFKDGNLNLKYPFDRDEHLQKRLAEILGQDSFIEEAEPDDSTQFKNYLSCFSFCIPCRVLGSDMHEDEGVAVLKRTLFNYSSKLLLLINSLMNSNNKPSEEYKCNAINSHRQT